MLARPLALLRAGAPSSLLLRALCSDAGPSVELTERCAARINKLAGGAEAARQLRLSVEPGGCSGFQYKFELEEASLTESGDVVFEKDGQSYLLGNSLCPKQVTCSHQDSKRAS